MQKKLNARLGIFLATSLLITGCGAGPNAPTRLIKQVTDGVEKTVGDIKLLHVLLINQSDGSAVLVGTFLNDGDIPEQLTGLSVNGIPATISPSLPVLSPNVPLIFSGDSANALAIIPGLNKKPGEHVSMQVSLKESGNEVLEVLVRERAGEFANVGAVIPN